MTACSKEVVEDDLSVYSFDEIKEEEIVVENDNLSLHFNPVTTQFYIVNKSNQQTWYSNPVDAENDTLAVGSYKKDLMSTIYLNYSSESGSPTSMNSYGSSVEKGNYTYEHIENGIRVNYTIADLNKVFIIPTGVSESRFLSFFDKIDASQQSMVKNNFKIYDINKPRKGENPEELTELYPDYVNEKIYVLREDTNNNALLAKVEGLFAGAGYTEEDYKADTANNQKKGGSKKPMFNVSIEYVLDEDSLLVRIPMKDIEYKSSNPIINIRPLGYFGAGGIEDEGFILIPEGSGGIINFNNGKESQNIYMSTVYGRDYAEYKDAIIDERRSIFPVYGISRDNGSMICVIEEGSAHSVIEADVSKNIHNYNYVAANYNLIRNALMNISAKTDTTVRRFQESLPDEDLVQRYIFIDDTDYSTMAKTYREYLVERYPQLVKKTESEVPMAVELIGALDRTKHVIGIPTRQPDELTSYTEAKQIIEKFVNHGVSNLSVKYNGWFNDGYLHTTPDKVKLVPELGSKKEFKSLVNYANDNDVTLYLSAAFQFVYNNGMFDNFRTVRDSVRYVNREIAELLPYSTIYYAEADWLYKYHLAKPSYYMQTIDSYAKEIADLGIKNISFRDIGAVLAADYDSKNEVSIEAAKNMQVEKLAQLKEQDYNIMVPAGNIYTVPYADIIVDMEIDPKRHTLIDEEVPFIQLALHGLVEYTGSPLNLSPEYKKAVLKSAETGAGLYFSLMAADSFELQDSRYVHYFSSDIENWETEAVELYKRFNSELGHTYNLYMVGHEKLANDVYMTEYEDGTKVIVNYNRNAYTYNGKEVPGMDFYVEGGKR